MFGVVIDNQLIWLFIIQELLTSADYLLFLENILPILLKEVPLQVRQQHLDTQDGAHSHFGKQHLFSTTIMPTVGLEEEP